jgi:ADP-ribose pyrophosphatase YjhB (NUDIX family)
MNRRNQITCKALFIKDGKILAIKKNENGAVRFILPGGRQEWGESFEDALNRECVEELGRSPDFVRQIAIIGERYYRIEEDEYHLTYIVFECEYMDTTNLAPEKPDTDQVGIEWLNINELDRMPFGPKKLGKYIMKYSETAEREMIFAGMINE